MAHMKSKAQSETANAVTALLAKKAWIAGQLQALTPEIIELEQSGAVPKSETDPRVDREARALELLNGSAYAPAKPAFKSRDAGIDLHEKLERKEDLLLALRKADLQLQTASIDLGREIVSEHDIEIRELHRQRALAVFAVMKLRLKLLLSGGIVAHELDGYSPRLFGQSNPPSSANNWPLRYLKLCIKSDVITQKELES
jgi:hypothetical protein